MFPGPLAGRADLLRRWHRFSGLALQGLLDQLLGDRMADLDGKFFEIGELGPPRRPLGTVEPIHQVFADALDVGLHLDQI
jgi:hypothetical protein